MCKKKNTAILTATALALGILGQPVFAQQSEKGLKDIYANYFRIGTCYPSNNTTDATLRNTILREFNSVTHENGLKPDATMQQSGSTDNDIKVAFNRDETKNVLAFCTTYNIPLRGHTLVWHSQTPSWFFYANMQNGNQNTLASKEVMYKRMESYIKNMFTLIKNQYPTLKLYAYDVVNEIFENNGKPRNGGFGGDNSPWVQVFGNNSFVDSAFTYARRHAPEGCKLFYNDFNEYHTDGKVDSMAALYTRLKAKGVIDGLGMQSHLAMNWPDIGTYKAAITKFAATGAEINVTELDLQIKSSSEAEQGEKYRDVFKALKEAREGGAKITSVSVWGVRDDLSWRSGDKPLLFTQNYTKKPAYTQVAALIPTKDHGDGKNPGFNTPDPSGPTTDENGYFFYHDFETGTTQSWGKRGDETVANSNTRNNTKNGSRSIYVSGRNQNWNGAQFSLPSDFEADKEYSFSVMARHDGQGTLTFKLSLQYQVDTGKVYPNIVEMEAPSGQWVQLAETNYKLPAIGTGFAIYVELDDASTSFYVDDAMGGVAGATINPDGTPGEPPPTSILTGKNTVRGHTPLITVRGRTLNVNSSNDSKVRVRLVNMMGKTIASFNANGNAKLSLKQIPAGAYIIEARRIKDGYKTTSAITLR